MIAAVAVIGVNNNPLFLRSYLTGSDELKFHYIVHASLDAVEDGVIANHETYLGLLYPNEDFRVYGYVTATNVKLIVVIDHETNDAAVKSFFEKFHLIYCNMACNPFYTLGDQITSKGFENEIAIIAAQF